MGKFSNLKESGMEIIAQKLEEGGLSIQDIRDNVKNINWSWISMWFQLNEEAIREFRDFLDWTVVRYHQDLSKDFKREFKDKLRDENN